MDLNGVRVRSPWSHHWVIPDSLGILPWTGSTSYRPYRGSPFLYLDVGLNLESVCVGLLVPFTVRSLLFDTHVSGSHFSPVLQT